MHALLLLVLVFRLSNITEIQTVNINFRKARKRLLHSQLIAELLTQLRFPAQTSDLKKRIESLIEREYLERDKDESTYYNYLA